MNKHPHKTENPLLKECLFTALIMLMDQKDFKDIKISEIAQKAGVSRMTYYRTYDSKEDILLQYFEDRSQEIVKIIKNTPDITPEHFFTLFYFHFKQQAHLIHYLFEADLLKVIHERFIDFITRLYEKSNISCADQNQKMYEIHFAAGGLFYMLIHWIEREMPETPEEMAQLTLRMLRLPSAGPENHSN